MRQLAFGSIVLILVTCGWGNRSLGEQVLTPRGELRIVDTDPLNWAWIAWNVFEHLVDPEGTIEQLSEVLRPGGFLYARIASEADPDRPQHIVQNFEPTFDRLRALGFVHVWEDEWLWGHKVFRMR